MPNCSIDIDARSILARFAMILMLVSLVETGSVGKARSIWDWFDRAVWIRSGVGGIDRLKYDYTSGLKL